jgi:hypothetical protein
MKKERDIKGMRDCQMIFRHLKNEESKERRREFIRSRIERIRRTSKEDSNCYHNPNKTV